MRSAPRTCEQLGFSRPTPWCDLRELVPRDLTLKSLSVHKGWGLGARSFEFFSLSSADSLCAPMNAATLSAKRQSNLHPEQDYCI